MCRFIDAYFAPTEMNIVNPPVKPSIGNTSGIAGSIVSFLVVITLIMVITIPTVVYCKRYVNLFY